MTPANYSANYQIAQGPGWVVLVNEMAHDARVIPLDGRPHLPANIRQWMGDARGHWEGNTLVVETTNFTDKTPFRGSSDKMRLVERFTRTVPIRCCTNSRWTIRRRSASPGQRRFRPHEPTA